MNSNYVFGVACFDDSHPSAACSHSASSSSMDFWCDDRLFDEGCVECLDCRGLGTCGDDRYDERGDGRAYAFD